MVTTHKSVISVDSCKICLVVRDPVHILRHLNFDGVEVVEIRHHVELFVGTIPELVDRDVFFPHISFAESFTIGVLAIKNDLYLISSLVTCSRSTHVNPSLDINLQLDCPVI